MRERRLIAALAAGGLGLLAAALLAGPQPAAFVAALFEGDVAAVAVLQEIRLPRSLGAWCAGALLGLAGALAQGLFRNPLADPYLLGSASGAGLGVALALLAAGVPGSWAGELGLGGAAFAGAIAGTLLTVALARGLAEGASLLLAGVVVAVFLGALTALAMQVEPDRLRGLQSFLLGTTALLSWPDVGMLALALVAVGGLAWPLSRALDAMSLGEDGARSLGVDARLLRRVGIALIALATAACVAQAGVIAFVGLVAPHVARRLGGGMHRVLLPASALLGGTLLLAADALSRALLQPIELPVGLLTAALGGAYLLALLRRGTLR